jgi:hypothetical protein
MLLYAPQPYRRFYVRDCAYVANADRLVREHVSGISDITDSDIICGLEQHGCTRQQKDKKQ